MQLLTLILPRESLEVQCTVGGSACSAGQRLWAQHEAPHSQQPSLHSLEQSVHTFTSSASATSLTAETRKLLLYQVTEPAITNFCTFATLPLCKFDEGSCYSQISELAFRLLLVNTILQWC